MEVLLFGGLAVLVDDNKVRRDMELVEHPASMLLRVVGTIVLGDFGRGTIEHRPRQNIESSALSIHQGPVEYLLMRAIPVAMLGIFEVRFDSLDSQSPCGPQIVEGSEIGHRAGGTASAFWHLEVGLDGRERWLSFIGLDAFAHDR